MAFDLGSLFVKLGLVSDDFNKGLDNVTKAVGKVGDRLKSMGQTMTKYVTAPLVAAGVASLKLASDFETSMTKIETLVGLASDRVNSMKGDVIALSNETARSSRELADALFVVTSAGQRGAEAMEILQMSAKAAAVGLGETKDIARTVTAILNAYGAENISAAKATDQLLAIVREGNLEASELAPTLGRVIGLASTLGIEFSEVGASIATFTRLGVDSAEAVTALRGIMNTLIAPSEGAREVLENMGFTFADLRKEIKDKGLAATLINLMAKFKGNDEALATLIPNVRALAGLLGTAGVQGETYAQIAKSIASANGLVDQGFERVSQDSGFKFKQTLEQLKNVGIQLGNILLPVVIKVLKVIQGLVQWFNSLSVEAKQTTVIIGGLAAALGPILVIVGTIVSAAASIGLPVIAAISAVIALAGSFYYLHRNWDAVKERLSDWSWWRNAIIDIIQFWIEYNPFGLVVEGYQQLAKLFDIDIRNPFEDMADALDLLKVETKEYENSFESFTEFIVGTWNDAKSKLSGLIPDIGLGSPGGGGAATATGGAVGGATAEPGAASASVGGGGLFGAGIMGGMQAFIEKAEEVADTTWNLESIFTNAFAGMQNVISDAFNGTTSILEGFKTFFINFIKGMIAKIIAATIAALILVAVLSAIPGFGGGNAFKGVKEASGFGSKLGAGIKAIAGFSEGGRVPSGFPNDSYPAFLSSGETVYPDPLPLPSGGGGMMPGKIKVGFDMRQFIIEFREEEERLGLR